MEELYRFEISNLSRAEFLDLQRQMPAGTVEARERQRSGEELGALDPVTASVIVKLGLAAVAALAAYLTKNRRRGRFVTTRVNPDGSREDVAIELDSSTSDADVIAALTKNMPKPPVSK